MALVRNIAQRIVANCHCMNLSRNIQMSTTSQKIMKNMTVNFENKLTMSSSNLLKSNPIVSCSLAKRQINTKGDRELSEFLQSEISAEKKTQAGSGVLIDKLDDFNVKYDGAEILLTKTFNDEKVSVHANINHSVNDEHEVPDTEQDQAPALKSNPNFEVDIVIGTKTISFTLMFMPEEEQEESQDRFGISEVTVYEGEWSEKTYAVNADILDENLYNLFMGMLEERGITSEFTEKFSHVCTEYEHNLYINLLKTICKTIKRE